MSRIDGVDPASQRRTVQKVLEGQARLWGAPLNNHLVYARRPDLFRAVRGMWAGINRDELLSPVMVALVNRRVASLNGCVF